MRLREDLNALTPRLRRYARALMSGHPGGCDRADDLVHATLLRALGSRATGPHSDLVIRLYATLTQMHRDVAGTMAPAPVTLEPVQSHSRSAANQVASVARPSKLTLGLMHLALDEREALLLVGLESFTHDEAARILHMSRPTLLTTLTRARQRLDRRLAAQGAQALAPRGREQAVSHLRLVK